MAYRKHTAKLLSPQQRSEIVQLRSSGMTVRQIAKKVKHSPTTITAVLQKPESKQELAEVGADMLETYRSQVRGMVPKALRALDKAITALEKSAELDPKTTIEGLHKVLRGSQVFRYDDAQTVTTKGEFDGMTPEQTRKMVERHREHLKMYGHPIYPGCCEHSPETVQ